MAAENSEDHDVGQGSAGDGQSRGDVAKRWELVLSLLTTTVVERQDSASLVMILALVLIFWALAA